MADKCCRCTAARGETIACHGKWICNKCGERNGMQAADTVSVGSLEPGARFHYPDTPTHVYTKSGAGGCWAVSPGGRYVVLDIDDQVLLWHNDSTCQPKDQPTVTRRTVVSPTFNTRRDKHTFIVFVGDQCAYFGVEWGATWCAPEWQHMATVFEQWWAQADQDKDKG